MTVQQNPSDKHSGIPPESVSASLAGSGLSHIAVSVIPRTVLLVATITLVAIALYITRPSTGTEAAHVRGDNVAPSGSSILSPSSHLPVSADTTDQHVNATTHNSVTVNGQDIPVPDNGAIHKTVKNGDTTTTINVSSSGDSSATHTSSNVSVHSSSSSSSSESGDGN